MKKIIIRKKINIMYIIFIIEFLNQKQDRQKEWNKWMQELKNEGVCMHY